MNDIFGHWPMVWHQGERAAWDVFGLRILALFEVTHTQATR